VYNWGVEWEIYFRSERRSPTRQINALLLVMFAVAADRGDDFDEEFQRMQNELIAALEAEPPRIIALTAGLKDYGMRDFIVPAYLTKLLEEEYELVLKEQPYWVFRRKGP
jgi:hypothetical protein